MTTQADGGAPIGNASANAAASDSTNVQLNAGTKPDLQVVDQGTTEGVTQINREFQEKSTLKNARDFGIPYIDIARTPLNPDFLKVLDVLEAKKARLIPFFKVGKSLRVAVEDPNRVETIEVIKKLEGQGYTVIVNLASSSGIDDAFKIYDKTQKYKKIEVVESIEEKSIQTYEKEIASLSDLPKKLEEVPAEEGLNLLNLGAMKTKSSDVHYEPGDSKTTIRFRIDGVLHKVFELPNKIYAKITEQIKYQSRMQLNLYTVPQDGRYVFNYNDIKIAVRTSSLPTPYGESFVCRYLSSDRKALTLEELGFQGLALKKLQKATQLSQGMILVTGPTGSGKSTTLYSMLNLMNTPENKVITLEDPVEYYMSGVTQSQIDDKHGYTFASGLRSILRQDPDIVMLGEIRDLQTAETAAQAALTGHVLLSTLHTNSALEAIPRLTNMGLPSFMVAPSINTLVAQRLVRKICSSCATMVDISNSERKEFQEILDNLQKVNPAACFEMPTQVPKVNGCEQCSNTGYSGRIVLAEVVTVDSEIKNLILNNASSVDMIVAARKEGIMTMREDGHLKVAQGLTTLEEVHRVTNFSV